MNNEFFTNLQNKIEGKGIEELQCIFYETARDLMNNYVLKIDELEIELTEIEFYYFECNNHQDLYVHLDKLQRQKGKLYVHKKGKGYGGIDLTFGNGKFYGGILIRGIKSDDENIFISGIGRVKKYISEKLNIENKYQIIQNFFEKLKNQDEISLEKKDILNYNILHSRRINLDKRINNDEFRNSLYRFARLDYIEIQKNKLNNTDKKKLEISYIINISNITEVCNKFPNENSKTEEIKKNTALMKNIEKFKECQKNLQENKN
jgi:molybdopterin converting factor small subunit